MEQLEFFGMPSPGPRQSGGSGRRWGGNDSRKARAFVRAMLPAPCQRCGGIISADDPESSWHAGHITDAVAGGEDNTSNYLPEHATCNTSAGGKVGAAITNARHQRHRPNQPRERAPQWW